MVVLKTQRSSGGFAMGIFNVTQGEKLLIGVGQTSIGTNENTFSIHGYSGVVRGGMGGDSDIACGGSGGGMSGIFRGNVATKLRLLLQEEVEVQVVTGLKLVLVPEQVGGLMERVVLKRRDQFL